MSVPSILQMASHTNTGISSLAFTSNVTNGSFLFAILDGAGQTTVSDNLNGSWTIMSSAEYQSLLSVAIAYLPVSKAGAVTVTFGNGCLPLIAEISPCSITASSPVASGTLATSNPTEFTSASISSSTGDLIFGWAVGTGSLVESAGGSYTIQSPESGPPYRSAFETQTSAGGSYHSDFFTPANEFDEVWITGVLALTPAASGGTNNAGLLRLLGVN
jgi:hypothetical protein